MIPKAYSYIRFSTPEQIKGDSQRRQMEYTQKVAKRLGLPLDSKLKLSDLGYSAYKGDHITKGSLGEFLKLVEAGQIAEGSVLIIENFDRLTREDILTAISLLTNLLNKGIDVYTAMDDKRFSKSNFSFQDLMHSAIRMSLSNEESAKKADRLKQTWKSKRAKARQGKTKLTGICPAWLDLNENGKEYLVNEPRAEVIRKIFRMKADGMGTSTIAKQLNGTVGIWIPEKKGRNKTGGWRESYIQKIIHSRSVLGEYQPHKFVNRKRVPDGEPIVGYFPAIVDVELFNAVQNRLKAYKEEFGHMGGKTGKAQNVFTHIAFCGKCNGSINYIDKGKPPKGAAYLRCENSRRGLRDEQGNRICDAKNIRYDDFFHVFFNNITEVDTQVITSNSKDRAKEIRLAQIAVDSTKEELAKQVKERSNLVDQIASTDSPEVRSLLEDKLKDVLQKVADCKGAITKSEETLNTLMNSREEIVDSQEKAEEIRNLLAKAETEDDRIELRTRLRSELKRFIRRIEIYPLEEKYVRLAEHEDEPHVSISMESKTVDRFRVRLKDHESSKAIVWLRRYRVDPRYI